MNLIAPDNKEGTQNVLQGNNYIPWVAMKWSV